ncbi:hypothetical protein MKZ38_003736 [Zalerion maritima]|uniref:Uncharacterized protein n=1 Tax=Zalerion maritima TaxID=339359 RepID=A0AAD5WV63_9PEZI|nr:hypothetical protein MKZ38_003736 [Zalerion maritima]
MLLFKHVDLTRILEQAPSGENNVRGYVYDLDKHPGWAVTSDDSPRLTVPTPYVATNVNGKRKGNGHWERPPIVATQISIIFNWLGLLGENPAPRVHRCVRKHHEWLIVADKYPTTYV